MEKTPIEIVYEVVVNNIDKIDNEIAYLKGKREAYNDIRLDLYPYLGEEEKDGNDD